MYAIRSYYANNINSAKSSSCAVEGVTTNMALSFDGSNDFVRVPDAADISILGDLTIV